MWQLPEHQINYSSLPGTDMEPIQLDMPDLNGKYFDFSYCKDYFITYVMGMWHMNVLINEAFDLGYELLFRDPLNLIVEMQKKKGNEREFK